MNNILEIKNLCKKYQSFNLDNINITIPEGVIVGFIGENGAGKTTTIKAILNLINISSGTVKIFNQEYKDVLKEDIGVVLDKGFFPETYLPKDINIVMKSIYTNWDEKLFYCYLEKFQLRNNQPIKELSTGMLMKLKIITALSHHPKLLILDEPTSGLDPIARNEILDILQEFVEDEKKSVLLSSHITTDLEKIADYIVFINKGKIMFSKETREIIDNYANVKCNQEQFESIDPKDIIKYKKDKYGYQILVENKKNFKKKYNIKTIDNITLDDVMLFYVKGE